LYSKCNYTTTAFSTLLFCYAAWLSQPLGVEAQAPSVADFQLLAVNPALATMEGLVHVNKATIPTAEAMVPARACLPGL
jgi:hypothetical protein